MATPNDVIVCKCPKICPTGIDEIVHYFPHKNQNFGSLSNCLYCVDRAQNLPRPASNIWLTSHNVPNFIQISSLLAEL